MDVIKQNINLKPYTYFKIGGPARFFIEVKTAVELAESLEFAKKEKLPVFIAGAASNILVADGGFPGLFIRMLLRDLKRDGLNLVAGAGVPMAVLAARAMQEGLFGLEWAVGIPGTVGGSIYGNAGCFGGEVKDALAAVKVFNTETGLMERHDNAFCKFAYRESVFKKSPHLIVLEGEFALRQGDPETSRKMVRHYTSERSDHQDIGSAAAGCVFKNVPWPQDERARERLMRIVPHLAEFKNWPVIPAGFLIDNIGLKGRRVGNVSISKKHANYLINNGGATAEEVIMLIGLIKEYIHRKYDLHLEEEIQYVGF